MMIRLVIVLCFVLVFIQMAWTKSMPTDDANDNTGTDLSGMKRLFNDTLSK
jgi:hypothetical protein